MREYEEIEETIKKEIPVSVTCNKCGNSKVLDGEEDYERQWKLEKFQSFFLSFGYGSKFDMEDWEFDLCEKCLVDFIRTFKHLPDGYDENYTNSIYDKL
jgi:hypothetical protein